MAISQVPISTEAFTHKVTSPAWKNKPTWYMVATEDRSINPDQERMMAKRAKAGGWSSGVEPMLPMGSTPRRQPSSSKRLPPPNFHKQLGAQISHANLMPT